MTRLDERWAAIRSWVAARDRWTLLVLLLLVAVLAGLLLVRPRTMTTRIWVNGVEVAGDPGDGSALQAALDAAKDGDVIELEAATIVTLPRPLVLPARANAASYVTLQTRGIDSLVAPGLRVTRDHGAALAEIRRTASSFNTLQTAHAATYWRLRGLRIRNLAEGADNYATIAIGHGAGSLANLPRFIELDRILVDLDDVVNPSHTYQQVTLFGRDVWMHHSHVSGVRSATDGDYSAVWIAYAPGPVLVEDNYLEAGGETVYIGSGNFFNEAGETANPTDVTIRRNHITRNLAWRGVYLTKNLLELKMGERVRIEGNLFTNQWVDAQATAIVISLRSEMMCATCPPSEPQGAIRDLTVTKNILKGGSAFITLSGIDASGWGDNPEQGGGQWPGTNFRVEHNLAIDLDPAVWGAGNYVTAAHQGPIDGMVFAHNTLATRQSYGTSLTHVAGLSDAGKITGLVWLNNVMSLAATCFSHAAGSHNAALETTSHEDRVIRGNVWGDDAGDHGALQTQNRYTDSSAFVLEQFDGEWRVKDGSPYKGAAMDASGQATGKDLGADMDAIQAAIGPELWAAAGFGPPPDPPDPEPPDPQPEPPDCTVAQSGPSVTVENWRTTLEAASAQTLRLTVTGPRPVQALRLTFTGSRGQVDGLTTLTSLDARAVAGLRYAAPTARGVYRQAASATDVCGATATVPGPELTVQ